MNFLKLSFWLRCVILRLCFKAHTMRFKARSQSRNEKSVNARYTKAHGTY